MERAAKERLIGAVVLVSAAWLLIPVFLDPKPAGDDELVTRDLALPERSVTSDGAVPMRRETIDLRTNGATDVRQEPPPPVTVLPVPAAANDTAGDETTLDGAGAAVNTADEDSAAEDSAARSEDTPPATASKPAPARTDAIKPAAPAAATTQPVTAEPLKRAADGAGQQAVAAGGQLWAVQLGSFSDKANAQRLAARYRDEGLPAFLSEVRQDGEVLHRVRIGPQSGRDDAEAVASRLQAAGQAARVVAYP